MSLPPKAIQSLLLIKASLISNLAPVDGEQKAKELSTDTPKMASKSVMITLSRGQKEGTSTTRMRHARAPNAYQRWRQRHDCW
jgi:hypothetical protein